MDQIPEEDDPFGFDVQPTADHAEQSLDDEPSIVPDTASAQETDARKEEQPENRKEESKEPENKTAPLPVRAESGSIKRNYPKKKAGKKNSGKKKSKKCRSGS